MQGCRLGADLEERRGGEGQRCSLADHEAGDGRLRWGDVGPAEEGARPLTLLDLALWS